MSVVKSPLSRVWLLAGVCLISLSAVFPAVAQAANASAPQAGHETMKGEKKPEMSDYQKNLDDASVMLAHVNLARLAIDYGMKDEARSNIESAVKLVAVLAEKTEKIESKHPVAFGHLTYKADEQIRDYYIPVVDEEFAVGIFDQKKDMLRDRFQISEKGADLVHRKIMLNLKNVNNELVMAGDSLNQDMPDAAAQHLDRIYDDAVVADTTATSPLWVIHDNLVLAKNLIGLKEYKAARSTLAEARKDMETYKTAHKDEDLAVRNADALIGEASAIDRELDREDPSLVQKLALRTDTLVMHMKGWFAMDMKMPNR